MTPEEIRAAVKVHKDEIDRLMCLQKAERHKLHAVQEMCFHPRLHRISVMGDDGTHCPDCGYGT